MINTREQVTLFDPTKDVQFPVAFDQLMQLSDEHHLGFVPFGERPPLAFPERVDLPVRGEMDCFPIRIDEAVNHTEIHPEAIRRHRFVEQELPNIDIVQVIIAHEVEDENAEPGRDWDAVARGFDEKVKAGATKAINKGKEWAPKFGKAGILVVAGVAVVTVAVAAVAVAAATATVAAPVTAGILVLGADPDYILVIADSRGREYGTHWVSICSWR